MATSFLSTLSLRRATAHLWVYRLLLLFLSTLSLRRATLSQSGRTYKNRISIHALLAESDSIWQDIRNVSPIFLSTLSLRRATVALYSKAYEQMHFYPRSPCGERQPVVWTRTHGGNFYPRSPCGERPKSRLKVAEIVLFLSTLSLRRATPEIGFVAFGQSISIHALLAESDGTGGVDANTWWEFLSTLSLRRATSLNHEKCALNIYFYPRSPCGERLPAITSIFARLAFLSTLSLRRATWQKQKYRRESKISIHALLAESDSL